MTTALTTNSNFTEYISKKRFKYKINIDLHTKESLNILGNEHKTGTANILP